MQKQKKKIKKIYLIRLYVFQNIVNMQVTTAYMIHAFLSVYICAQRK